MTTLLRLAFGFGLYAVAAYAMGRHLRLVAHDYPLMPCTSRAPRSTQTVVTALPATLPQRSGGLLVSTIRY